MAPTEPRSRFVGRVAELAELERALDAPVLVSLIGPGGVGKTRLAGEIAARLAEDVEPVFVWLDEIGRGEDVLPQLARALGLTIWGTGDEERIAEALRENGKALLIIDNAEHVIEQVREVVLLAALSEARVIVTTRIALDVAGERQIHVDPLPLADARVLLESRMASFGVPSEVNADSLLNALDCLPLAIELAAARTRVLSLDQIVERLQSSNQIIASPSHARHGTLDRTIEWSWNLLDADERALAATVAWFDLPIAPSLAEGLWPELELWDLAQALEAKSWLRVVDTPSGKRWTALWSIRRFVDGAIEGELRVERDTRLVRFALQNIKLNAAWWADHVPAGVAAAKLLVASDDFESAARLLPRLFFGAFGGPYLDQTVSVAIDLLQAWPHAEEGAVWARLAADVAKATFRTGGPHRSTTWAKRAAEAAPPDDPTWLKAGAQYVQCLIDDGEFDAADERLSELVDGTSRFPLEIGIASAYVDLITAAHDVGRFDVVRQSCDALEAIAVSAGNTDARARAWYHRAYASYDLGDFARADDEVRTLKMLEAGDPREKLSYGGAVAPLVDLRMGRNDGAYQALQSRAALARRTGYYGLEFHACIGLAEWATRNDDDKTLGFLERAATISRLSLSPKSAAHADLLLALREVGLANFHAASTRLAKLREVSPPTRPETWNALLDAVEWFCTARLDGTRSNMPPTPYGQLVAAVDTALKTSDDASLVELLGREPGATWNLPGLYFMRLDDVARDWVRRLSFTTEVARLQIEPDGRRYRLVSDAIEDISRRGAMRRILVQLAHHRIDSPGEPLPVEAVIEAGWPDEIIEYDAALTRVYTTMNRLRALGFGDWLLTLDEGYALDTALEVSWVTDLRGDQGV